MTLKHTGNGKECLQIMYTYTQLLIFIFTHEWQGNSEEYVHTNPPGKIYTDFTKNLMVVLPIKTTKQTLSKTPSYALVK